MPPGTHGPAGQSERGFFLFDWQVVSARKRCVVIPAEKPKSSAMDGTLDGLLASGYRLPPRFRGDRLAGMTSWRR